MIKRKALVGLIVATIVATFAFSPGLETQAAEGRRVVIEIRTFEFAPFAPDVKPGDVIVWINRDIVPHTASADNGSWDSGQINPGGKWQMVVKDGLVESYYCRFHPSMTARLDITKTR
jgi:plastocyanin